LGSTPNCFPIGVTFSYGRPAQIIEPPPATEVLDRVLCRPRRP
jgi:hypothetical protein